jgi:trigger factor
VGVRVPPLAVSQQTGRDHCGVHSMDGSPIDSGRVSSKGGAVEVQVQEKGPFKRELAITVSLERIESEMEKLVESYRRRAALPGFRKGKAPTDLVRVQFQGNIESDLLNDLIPDAFEEALAETKIKPVAPPLYHDIRFEPGKPLTFCADVEIQPEIHVSGYRELELEQEITEVDDSMIGEMIEMMRGNRATYLTVERPAASGDVIKAVLEPIDVHGKKLAGQKREEVKITVGSPTLLPEFRQAAEGISAGESRTVEVHYPEDFGDEDLAGKIRRFRLIAQEIQEKKLPEVDDNFAQSIDSKLDLEGLRAKVRLRLEAEELMRSKQRLEEQLMDRLMRLNPFDVPEGMVEYRLERALERARDDSERFNEEGFRERFRVYVERVCRRELIFDALTTQENLALTDQEIESELENLAQEAGVETSVIRKKMEADGEFGRFQDTMQERKILEFLLSTARINRVRKPRVREEAEAEAR